MLVRDPRGAVAMEVVCIFVCAGPELRRAVLRPHIHNRHIDHHSKGWSRVLQPLPELRDIGVNRLVVLAWERCIAGVEVVFHARPQNRLCHLDNLRVEEHILKEIGGKRWGSLLDIALVEVKGHVRTLQDRVHIGQHLFAKNIAVCRVYHIL